MSQFEVVRSDVDGWDVRRVGETQALSNYPNRELAEAAAKKQQEAEDESGSSGGPVDVRQNVYSEGPEEDLDAKGAFLTFGTMMIGVIVLLVVLAIIIGVTNFGG